MTKTAIKVFRQLHDAIVESGVSRSDMPPAARDGYAALWLWMSGGQSIERLAVEDVGLIPPSLRLDVAPLRRQAVGYILSPSDWIVLARAAATEPIRVGAMAYAFPEPMLVWSGWRGARRSVFTGAINLRDTPTIIGLRLRPGKNYGELGDTDLIQADADDDLLAVAKCLRRFYAAG